MDLYKILGLVFLVTAITAMVTGGKLNKIGSVFAILSFISYNYTMPVGMNIRIDLLVAVPMVLVVVIKFLYLQSKNRLPNKDDAPETRA